MVEIPELQERTRKRKRRKPKPKRVDTMGYVRVRDVTHKKIRVCAVAEDLEIQDFMDLLVTEYVVKRGLEVAVAKVINNADLADQTRERWERELRAKWEHEFYNRIAREQRAEEVNREIEMGEDNA